MDLKSIFGGVAIGKDTSNNIRPSLKGLAVQAAPGKWVAFDAQGGMVDVSGLDFDGAANYIYRIPVPLASAQVGDLIVTSENPFNAVFVSDTSNVAKDGTIVILNPADGTKVPFSPVKNLFGPQFLVKVVSLVDGLGANLTGNNLLPLLLLGGQGGAGQGNDPLSAFLLAGALGTGGTTGQPLASNPALLLALAGGSGGNLSNILALQALSGSTNLLGTTPAATPMAKAKTT